MQQQQRHEHPAPQACQDAQSVQALAHALCTEGALRGIDEVRAAGAEDLGAAEGREQRGEKGVRKVGDGVSGGWGKGEGKVRCSCVQQSSPPPLDSGALTTRTLCRVSQALVGAANQRHRKRGAQKVPTPWRARKRRSYLLRSFMVRWCVRQLLLA